MVDHGGNVTCCDKACIVSQKDGYSGTEVVHARFIQSYIAAPSQATASIGSFQEGLWIGRCQSISPPLRPEQHLS